MENDLLLIDGDIVSLNFHERSFRRFENRSAQINWWNFRHYENNTESRTDCWIVKIDTLVAENHEMSVQWVCFWCVQAPFNCNYANKSLCVSERKLHFYKMKCSVYVSIVICVFARLPNEFDFASLRNQPLHIPKWASIDRMRKKITVCHGHVCFSF